MGIENEEDLWKIKKSTDAFFHRIGMMLSQEEELETIEREIEGQHYFQPIFEKLRKCPNDTLLSELVNTEIDAAINEELLNFIELRESQIPAADSLNQEY